MKVRFFKGSKNKDLAEKVNNFLNDIEDENIIDIKYSFTEYMTHGCMVMYKQ
ncbi:sporulation protein Cse60 [Candidatus Pacearchaeota archaeon]|nr:sporulation protein Cse60 [Candidatus Pacearchaeota archaeon]